MHTSQTRLAEANTSKGPFYIPIVKQIHPCSAESASITQCTKKLSHNVLASQFHSMLTHHTDRLPLLQELSNKYANYRSPGRYRHTFPSFEKCSIKSFSETRIDRPVT